MKALDSLQLAWKQLLQSGFLALAMGIVSRLRIKTHMESFLGAKESYYQHMLTFLGSSSLFCLIGWYFSVLTTRSLKSLRFSFLLHNCKTCKK